MQIIETVLIQTGQGRFDYRKRGSVLGSCSNVNQDNLFSYQCNVNSSIAAQGNFLVKYNFLTCITKL